MSTQRRDPVYSSLIVPTTDSNGIDSLAPVTARETLVAIVESAERRLASTPLRRSFLQAKAEDEKRAPAPIAEFVRSSDKTGLNLYLLALTKASAEPWDVALPSVVWARALGLPLPDTASARSTISKAWLRLERRKLIMRGRRQRMAHITMLREDGSGADYNPPGSSASSYLRLPHAYWIEGPEGTETGWYQSLSVPGIAVLLIALSHGDEFRLPLEDGAEWYSVSPDSIGRGLAELRDRDLLDVTKETKKAPLSATGYTQEYRYTLRPPFGPKGRRSQRRAS